MNSTPGRWPAPGKLNLFLHIVGRRPDGYHLLQTVFQFLDRTDLIELAVRNDGKVRLHQPVPGVPASDDLTVRAALLLKSYTRSRLGVDIRVRKRLPLGGGLGGGSSDAASVLCALDELWRLGLGRDRLAALGAELGADVPVFIGGEAAWAEGVGDILKPVELPEPWYVVVVPPVHVATATVFSDPDLTRDTPLTTMCAFLAGRCGNDCEAVVHRRYPEVAAAARSLSRFGLARMTGTGACVFADFAKESEARTVLGRLHEQNWDGFVARGMNRSPLLKTMTGT